MFSSVNFSRSEPRRPASVRLLLEEDYHGVPFSIVVYSDENGHLVNTNRFVENINPTRKLSFEDVQKREEKDPAVRKQESDVNYPGEIVLVKEKIPRYTEIGRASCRERV